MDTKNNWEEWSKNSRALYRVSVNGKAESLANCVGQREDERGEKCCLCAL